MLYHIDRCIYIVEYDDNNDLYTIMYKIIICLEINKIKN